MRRAARTDANLTATVDAFRELGCSVHVTNGAWDLTVGYGGISMLVEVKDGAKKPSARKFTPAQVKFRKTWTGGIRLVQNMEDVALTVATIRKWHSLIFNSFTHRDGQSVGATGSST